MAEKAGFGMILSETLKTGFVASMLIYIHVNADPILIYLDILTKINVFMTDYKGVTIQGKQTTIDF